MKTKIKDIHMSAEAWRRAYRQAGDIVFDKMDKKINKYKNKPQEYTNFVPFARKYQSKREAEFAQKLDLLKREGKVLSWIPQVRFDLPGQKYHYVDFMVFYKPDFYPAFPSTLSVVDVSISWVKFYEIKGRDLPMGKLKRNQVEKIYDIIIEVIY